ncbi:hypothetical protein GCK72_010339 [Caenorhabditis remanei]|uniref:Uncharacterized protein n=1 Tax=Caenorhabditis remanei TaxID=31234 RepID=A0A6A5H4G5_CAERE|nr:hypothetical protein GCK72_010339 [Caenorhabditis remanei]KAF1762077.1 hypothetical protein GCK72_010339 [Caenorhabditis remanei]
MICIECGGAAVNNTELCQSCMEMNSTGTMSLDMARQCDITMSCGSCQRMVTADSRQCSSCQKSFHLSCDSSEVSHLNGFICSLCRRRNQILSEDVMLSASVVSSRSQNAPLSPFSDPSVQQMSLHMSSGTMSSSFPSNPDFGGDIYSQMTVSSSMNQHQHHVQQMLTTQSQLMDDISDGGATNDSDRNSSPFYQETSDYDEDFVLTSTRGRGRGSGKKKPGRGQSTGSRRQTNPGPTGFFSATQFQAMGDFSQPTPTRGKRGKRGNGITTPRSSGKGPGRGRGRGRGSAAQIASQLQQVQYGNPAPMGMPMYHPGNPQLMHMNSVGFQMMPQNSIGLSSTIQSTQIPPSVPLPSSIMNNAVPIALPPPVQTPLPEQSPTIVPNFQETNKIDTIREVDESILEDENSRQSGTSRSDEVEYTRISIVCRSNDEFMGKAPLCLVCGSIGKGVEASMVACSNCAQTYHTYCISLHDKKFQLNSAVITRGWRCLDCTFCEGCGAGGDEEKLLLCEECDVSYHMYCIKPPLEAIPKGPWRCQWCSRCRRCNHKSTSGNDLTSKGLCHSCQSLQSCSRCNRGYHLNEKIIKCSQCSKWHHGFCEGLHTDEQLEQAALNRMRCTSCRPNRAQINGFSEADTVWCDNVALDRNAHEILKSKYTPSALKSQMQEYRESFDHYEEDFTPQDDASEPGSSLSISGQRGRGRGNPSGRRGMNRIGIGGFYAKLPRHRIQALTEEAAAEEDDTKKAKRPRKPRRSQLEDAYPPQIQEAFFGIKAVEGKSLVEYNIEEPMLAEFNGRYVRERPLKSHTLCKDAAEMLRNDQTENDILEGIDFGNMDTDINFDEMDLSIFFDEDDEELEDSLQGETHPKRELPEGSYGPTTFNLDQKPSTSTGGMSSGMLGPQDGNLNGMNPVNFAQHAPGVRTAIARSGSHSDAPDRYQFSARWEEDEPAGLMATTAAVLYANEKHPHLKVQLPIWSDRVKQIQKLWRNLSSDDRQEYVNRARDNRTKSGSKPRPRRTNVQSTNSVDSPTVQSPAPHQFGFKVPTNPGEPSSSSAFGSQIEQSQQPKQVRVTNHLSAVFYNTWQEMRRVKLDRERLLASLEEQLNKARKQKKNLAAKKRQMVRTQQAAPDYDGRQIDLNDNDQKVLAQLTEQIKSTQGEMENMKKDVKSQDTALHQFELHNKILRNESEVTPLQKEQTHLRELQFAAHAEQMLAQPPPLGLGMNQSQGHPQPGTQAPINLPLLQQQQQRMLHLQGVPMMRPGPGQFIIRQQPGAPPMTMQQHQQQQQEMHRRMVQMRHPALIMGGVRFDEITDPVMKEAYQCLDAILADVHQHIESQKEVHHPMHGGPPAHIMQRMMHHQGAPIPRLIMPGQIPQGQIPPQHHPGVQLVQQHPPMTPQSAQPLNIAEDGPKPKKKRNNQKKATSSYPAGGEYESWLETMRTRFRLCGDIPKKQREPRLNRAGCEFVKYGLTEMAVVGERKPLLGEFGAMHVKRGTRIFGNEERAQKALIFNDVNMYQVEPPIRLVALYNNTMPTSEDDVIQDEMDENTCLNPNAALCKLFNKKHTVRDHIRCCVRYMDEGKAPIQPESSMFNEIIDRDEEVTVELVFNTSDIGEESSVEDKKDLVFKLNEKLKDLLALKEEVPWKMEDTPPESPICFSPEPEGISEGIRQTTSTSRAPSASVEKEIKKEEDEDASAAPVFREVKNEVVDSTQQYQCKQCNVSIDGVPALRVTMAKLGVLSQEATLEEKDEMVSFCSRKCYFELMSLSRSALTHEELTAAEQVVSEEIYNKLKQIYSDNIVKAVNQGKKPPAAAFSASSLIGSTEHLVSPRDTRYMMDEGKKDNIIIVPVSSLIGAVDAPKEAPPQRTAAGEDWKAYTQDIHESFINIQQQHVQCILSPKIGVPHPPYELDKRICVFCGGVGDGETFRCGRLISLTEYYWVHVNCALWSAEVFEHPSGWLTNVDRAVVRAAQTACDHCKQPGASVKCHKMNCGANYHVLCAMQHNGFFIKDRTFICKLHEKVTNVVLRLDALRKIYIKRDENSLLMRLFDLSDGPNLCLRIGAFAFHKLGSINPSQLKKFHNKDYIFPSKYRATRLFWSPKNARERMMFECRIEEKNDLPFFVVQSLEDSSICHRGFSATKAWQPIFERVNQLRDQQQGEVLKFFGTQVCGETLFGLNENAITKITESLPGFDTIFTYQHRHQNSPVLELPLVENQMGCARAEPRNRTIGQHFRTKPQPMGGTSHNHHGILGVISAQSTLATVATSAQLDTLASRQAATSVTSANSGRTRGVRSYYTEEAAARARAFGIPPEIASLSLRMETNQNNQAGFSAYQKMRREWKDRVYLARSRIAGLGLYAKNDISMGEFIIEYKGEIIRAEVCEVREIRYTAQNRGVYMFRIDEEWVIDATMAGGPARYINHSCDPNCSTQILDAGSSGREKKIIITANRPISSNEELTYDYQFELEGTTDKIPCLCGAPNCVKWMN